MNRTHAGRWDRFAHAMRVMCVAWLPAVLVTTARAQDALVPDDFPTIQAAVLGAHDLDGDGRVAIVVRAGRYRESVLIERSHISLDADLDGTTTILGVGGAPTIRVRHASDVDVRAFELSAPTTENAIEVIDALRCRIEAHTIVGALHGVRIERCLDVLVGRVRVSGCTHAGISIRDSHNVLAVRNVSSGNGGHGIELRGIRLGLVLENDVFANAGDGLHLYDVRGLRIDGNVVRRNARAGLLLERARRNLIVGNRAQRNAASGVRMLDTFDNAIWDNAFSYNLGWGIRRREWRADDFAPVAGTQAPPGQNEVVGNSHGAVRSD